MNDRYLTDPEIRRLLDDIEDRSRRLVAYREDGNYAGVSFECGTLLGTLHRIHQRNAEIDRVPEETMGN